MEGKRNIRGGERKREGTPEERGEEKPPKNPSIRSPDMNRTPAVRWTSMQQLKSVLSIYIYWRRETSAVYC